MLILEMTVRLKHPKNIFRSYAQENVTHNDTIFSYINVKYIMKITIQARITAYL